MRLTDIMSGAGLAGYAVIAMLIFMAAFVAILVWIFRPSRRRELEADREIPFQEDERAPDTRNRGEG